MLHVKPFHVHTLASIMQEEACRDLPQHKPVERLWTVPGPDVVAVKQEYE